MSEDISNLLAFIGAPIFCILLLMAANRWPSSLKFLRIVLGSVCVASVTYWAWYERTDNYSPYAQASGIVFFITFFAFVLATSLD